MNQEFGTTSWGRAWLRLAEPVTLTRPDPALPRARSLARRDRVTQLSTDPGEAAAIVVDNVPRSVVVRFPVWDEDQRRAAASLLATTTPADLAEELPDDLHRAGASVAPPPGSLDLRCDCPRTMPRCLHVLAVLVELARRVDEDPCLALVLLGASTVGPSVKEHSRIPLVRLDAANFYTTRTA